MKIKLERIPTDGQPKRIKTNIVLVPIPVPCKCYPIKSKVQFVKIKQQKGEKTDGGKQ